MFVVVPLLCVWVCICIYVYVFVCICVFIYVWLHMWVTKVGVSCLLGLLSTLFNAVEGLPEPRASHLGQFG